MLALGGVVEHRERLVRVGADHHVVELLAALVRGHRDAVGLLVDAADGLAQADLGADRGDRLAYVGDRTAADGPPVHVLAAQTTLVVAHEEGDRGARQDLPDELGGIDQTAEQSRIT